MRRYNLVFQENVNEVYDSLTKMNCISNAVLIYNRTWDIQHLINFFISKKDLRNPITNEQFSLSEIELIKSKMTENEKTVFDASPIPDKFPANVNTSIRLFLEEQATTCIYGILSLTESFIENQEMANELQNNYNSFFNLLKSYIGGMFHIDPVFSVHLCTIFVKKLKHGSEDKILIELIENSIDMLNYVIFGFFNNLATDEIIKQLNTCKTNQAIVHINI